MKKCTFKEIHKYIQYRVHNPVLEQSTLTLKNISSETTRPNSMKLHIKLPWMPLYKNTTRGHD